MPTYDYECGSCGHTYELFQSITARPEKKCPACGRKTAKRLIGTGGTIIFKGPGFYVTDYRSESYKKAAKAEAEAAGGGAKDKADGKAGTKQESKPPTAAESKSGESKRG
ncbi:MAG: zinc ribbon domain-containing protein [Phycisphaerae bacterium]|jgi:putative FmdB family regulatory protein